MSEAFDIGPLTWVHDEIKLALDQVVSQLEAFETHPENTSTLKHALTHLNQVRGALDMVGLEGCKRFCFEIETLISVIEKQVLAATQDVLATIKQALFELTHYLQTLLNGEPDQALKLFDGLEKMANCRGEVLEPSVLFFPTLNQRPPQEIQSQAFFLPEDSSAFLNTQRNIFQRALLEWLKSPLDANLQDMIDVLEQVQLVQEQASQRLFWWVASAFVHTLAQAPIAQHPYVKKTLRRIDQQLRALESGNSRANQLLLKDMLYFIAVAEVTAEKISQVKSLFLLEDLMPKADPKRRLAVALRGSERLVESQSIAPVVNELEMIEPILIEVEHLKSIWMDVSQDKAGAFASFVDKTQTLLDLSGDWGQQGVIKLLVSMNVFAQVWDESGLKPTEDALVEVAAGLALLDDALRHYSQINHDDLAHLMTQAQRIQNISQLIMGDVANVNGAQHGLADDVLNALATQIKDALSVCEQILDGVFRSPEKTDDLNALKEPFKQLLAAFDMLNMPTPMQVISVSQQITQQFGLQAVQTNQFERLADALSLLRLFVEDLPRINASRLNALDLSLSALRLSLEVQTSSEDPLLSPSDLADAAIKMAQEDVVEDDEMQDVFLQEAEEVIASIAVSIQSLKENLIDSEHLIALRRGFHTLKGSGRMVGLTSLGELAWLAEGLFNQVIDQNITLKSELIDFAERVAEFVADALVMLSAKKSFHLDLSVWRQEADKLQLSLLNNLVDTKNEQLLIGGTQKISRALFEIFIEEAHQHLHVLNVAQTSLSKVGTLSSLDAVRRAAHTLASNSGAAGFPAIESLSRHLEYWLDEELINWSARDVKLFTQCVTAIGRMLEKAKALTPPKRATKLIKEIKDAIALVSQTALTVVDAEDFTNEQEVVDDGLLEMFAEESIDLLRQSGEGLRAWHSLPDARSHAENLQRALHTLKGSARMVGKMALGEAVHALEDVVTTALTEEPDRIDFDGLFEHLDLIANQLERKHATVAQPALDISKHDTDSVDGALTSFIDAGAQQLRLRADVLDRLVNDAGEISIARSRMEREMQSFKHYSHDLTDTLVRLKAQLREMEIEAESTLQSRMAHLQEVHESFDPLEFDRFTRLQELTRLMAETVNDVATVQQSLTQNLDETESALSQQSRMNRELQYTLIGIRMVPFFSISERLHRIVRQTARELGKRAQLVIDGEHVDIDRSMLEHIAGALEHLLRNAVAHGLEVPEGRAKARKDLLGHVSIKVKRENDEISIVVTDDGAGVRLDKIRHKAVEQGRMLPDQEVSDPALLAMMFEPGFSTASAVSQISGRGVGLDAVRSEVSALGGRIDVANNEGVGAAFSLYLPVTLSVAQVVMVRVGSLKIALPAVMVEQVHKIKLTALTEAQTLGAFAWNTCAYPLHYLGRLIGAEHEAESQVYTPIILLRSGQHLIALQVDEVVGNQELVMKPLGPQLARMAGVVGASVLGDGQIVYVLNPLQIAHRERLVAGGVSVSHKQSRDSRPMVLVVDDSLTMRKVMSRLLERANYRVVTAINGIDALQALQELRPDIILTDIEMPHMDGFDLVRHLRNDALTATIPIVVISSRTAEKHQTLAANLGVNGFMGKPIHEDALLTHLSSLLA